MPFKQRPLTPADLFNLTNRSQNTNMVLVAMADNNGTPWFATGVSEYSLRYAARKLGLQIRLRKITSNGEKGNAVITCNGPKHPSFPIPESH